MQFRDRRTDHPAAVQRFCDVARLGRQRCRTVGDGRPHRRHAGIEAPARTELCARIPTWRQKACRHDMCKGGVSVPRRPHCTGHSGKHDGERRSQQAGQNRKPL